MTAGLPGKKWRRNSFALDGFREPKTIRNSLPVAAVNGSDGFLFGILIAVNKQSDNCIFLFMDFVRMKPVSEWN